MSLKPSFDSYVALNLIPFSINITWNAKNQKKTLNPPKGWQDFTNKGNHFKPRANTIALRTGKDAGLFVFDVDNEQQWIAYLQSLGQEEPYTVKARTGSGGVHLYFKWTPEVDHIKSTSKTITLNGVKQDFDVRNEGGMIIAPPSSYARSDGTIASYSWERSFDDCDLAECPKWLVEAFGAKAVVSDDVTHINVQTGGGPDKQSFPVFKNLANFIFDKCRILESKLDKLIYFSDSDTFNVQTTEKICPFARREHRSNHQYIVLNKAGKMWQRCHSGNCQGKESEHYILPEDILKELHSLINLSEPVSKELIKLACKEGENHVMDITGRSTTLVPAIDKTLMGDLGKLFCTECGQTKLQIKLGPQGSYMVCKHCGSIFPKTGGHPYSLDKINLQNYMNVTFNIGSIIVNNGTQEEFTIGWNQFVDDPITVFQDQNQNKVLLKAMSGTHTRIGDLFVALYKDQVVYCSENSVKPWYVFNNGWKNVEETDVKLLLRSDDFLEYFVKVQKKLKSATGIDNADAKAKQISSVLMKLETDGYKTSVLRESEALFKKLRFFDCLDKDRSLLGFDNGVYDLTKGEFRKYTPKDLVTLSVGFEYDETLMYHDEDTIQEINNFMFSVFPDPEVCKYVIKFLASCLAGYADDQLFHFGFGTGSNGKGILIKLMLETLGQYGGTLAASFLTGKTPDADAPTPALTNIVNKRFVAISETIEGAKINEQLFKSMCGQDKLIYRPMRQEAREFEPDFKLFMVCNDLPEFKGSDYAMKRRIRVIPFVTSFKDKPDECRGEKPLDKTLNGKVRNWRHAFMGLLLQGYQLYLYEALSPPKAILEATRKYEADNNTYCQFLDMFCIKKLNSELQVSEVGKKYMEWCALTFGTQTIKYKQENKYTPKITEELEKDLWKVKKDKRESGFVYVDLAWK